MFDKIQNFMFGKTFFEKTNFCGFIQYELL